VTVLVTAFNMSVRFRQFVGIHGEEALRKSLQQIQAQQAKLDPI